MTAHTCVKARLADPALPPSPSNIARCGAPAVTYSVGDGHQSFYCEAHSPRDDQGYYRYPTMADYARRYQ